MNHKLNKKKVAFVIIIAVLIISLGVFLFNNVNRSTKKETPKKVQEKTVQKEEKKKEEPEVNFTISFAGDCTLGNYAGQAYDGSFNQEYKRKKTRFNKIYNNGCVAGCCLFTMAYSVCKPFKRNRILDHINFPWLNI